jgi:hypothetical protein
VRALLIDDAAKEAVNRVLKYALIREHWYEPGYSLWIPGEDRHYVVNLSTYRCVFSITKKVIVFRHLGISVPSNDYPNAVAAFAIAELFGFTGWDQKQPMALPKSWMVKVNRVEHCIELAQPYYVAEASA